jgi:spore germination protein YaaH/flagellar hook assembly protein FlgD
MSLPDRRPVRRIAAITFVLVVQTSWVAPVVAASPKPSADDDGGLLPTIHYEDARAHAKDRIDFAPGGRVTVGFDPRRGDAWKVGGLKPRALPAGRLNGRQLREQGSPERIDLDRPVTDPAKTGDAVGSAWTPGATEEPSAPAAAVSSSGLRREVFGFLPYWELSDRSTTLDFTKLSTVAYFGVGIDAKGNLQKRNSDGRTTVGWSGWTSSRMTNLINAAHQKRTRVVLTVQSFAWTSGQLDRQKRFLGSATARANLARQVAAAVRDRGADGVNLDLEPLARGYEDEFTALVRRMRSELNNVRPGYQLTFDVTGHIGNYPIERATASGAADAILIMGYDYRTAGSSPVGSIAPLSRTGYDIRETVRAFKARVPASKLILGVPYYGRAWSTNSDNLHATNISGTKYGASTTVPYENAVGYLAEHGKRYDGTEAVAWTAYKRENCTSTYGCVKPWRQLYVDDARALRAKYDLVNSAGLRGVGIWALGYDGSRTELWKAIGDKFAPDTKAPVVGIRNLAPVQANPAFTVVWTGTDASGIKSYDTQVSINGGTWKAWLSKTTATKATYVSLEGRSYAFRVRARDVLGNTGSWTVATTWVATPKLRTGGFGRVQIDGLSLRSSASTKAAKVGTADSGDLLALTGGPVTSGGYTWFLVNGPVHEWGIVGSVTKNAWVAARNATTRFVKAAAGPNSTTVRPVIAKLGLGPDGAAAIGTSATDAASRSFSPDGDGVKDSLRVSWTSARAMGALELRIFDADGTTVDVRKLSGGRLAAGAHDYAWDGKVDGTRLPNGTYLVALVGSAGETTYSNPSTKLIQSSQLRTHGVRIDVANPNLTTEATPTTISPNGDDVADRTALAWSSNEPLNAKAEILRGSMVVRSWSYSGKQSATLSWNGRNAAGDALPDGPYTFRVRGRDAAGNPAQRDIALTVDRTLKAVSRSPSRFYPQDGDALKPATKVKYELTRAATVTLQVFRGEALMKNVYRDKAFAKGAYSWTWKGRGADGEFVPRGLYTLRLTATSTSGTTVRTERVLVDAFRTTLSATTRTAGQKLTVTVLSVEPLRAAPRISLRQAGASAVTKTATRTSSGEYRATFTIAAGAPGSARITIRGTDTSGGTNRSSAEIVVR